jgi:addiction module RelE/StbE family toxin
VKLIWSPEARADLREMVIYLSEKNPFAARALYKRIEVAANEITDSPYIGRPGRVPGTREFVITNTPYILPYQVRSERIEVLRVYHAARKWPDQFRKKGPNTI